MQKPLLGQLPTPKPAAPPSDRTVLLLNKQPEQRLDEAAFTDNMSKE
jgi:hypothetical protein